jgi:hypothetical protein
MNLPPLDNDGRFLSQHEIDLTLAKRDGARFALIKLASSQGNYETLEAWQTDLVLAAVKLVSAEASVESMDEVAAMDAFDAAEGVVK